MAPFPESKGSRRPPRRSASFNGRDATPKPDSPRQMRRPKTQCDLLAVAGGRRPSPPETTSSIDDRSISRKLPAKVPVNVTVQRSPGPVQVMAMTEWTVGDLVLAALRIYIDTERSPSLPSADPFAFGLHYSQFFLESLDPQEKVINLGSRSFFLCPKATTGSAAGGKNGACTAPPAPAVSPPLRCGKQVENGCKIAIPWLRFMDFLM